MEISCASLQWYNNNNNNNNNNNSNNGRYPSRIKEADVDTKATNQWLKSSGLKAETEGLIIAAQDQTPRAYHHHIIKDGTDPHCRICKNPRKLLTILSRAAQS